MQLNLRKARKLEQDIKKHLDTTAIDAFVLDSDRRTSYDSNWTNRSSRVSSSEGSRPSWQHLKHVDGGANFYLQFLDVEWHNVS